MSISSLLEAMFWNVYAIAYDVLADLKPYQDMHSRVIELLEITPNSQVLDAGCGTGNLLQRIRKLLGGKNVQIEGCDFSQTMLDRARTKLPGAKLWRADFNRDIGAEKTYDSIVSTNVVYILIDPEGFIKKLFALLRPGGTLVVVTPHKDMNSWLVLAEHIQALGWRSLPSICRMFFPLVIVAISNLIIDMREKFGSYNAFDETRFVAVFSSLGNFKMERTYAGQAMLAAITKKNVAE